MEFMKKIIDFIFDIQSPGLLLFLDEKEIKRIKIRNGIIKLMVMLICVVIIIKIIWK